MEVFAIPSPTGCSICLPPFWFFPLCKSLSHLWSQIMRYQHPKDSDYSASGASYFQSLLGGSSPPFPRSEAKWEVARQAQRGDLPLPFVPRRPPKGLYNTLNPHPSPPIPTKRQRPQGSLVSRPAAGARSEQIRSTVCTNPTPSCYAFPCPRTEAFSSHRPGNRFFVYNLTTPPSIPFS